MVGGHAEPKSTTGLVAGVTTWSQSKADSQLLTDIVSYENSVNNYFTRTFNQNQFDALVSFAYNLGGAIFSNSGWSKLAVDSWITSNMMLYINKGTQFEAGLTRRRQAEVDLYNTKVANDTTATTDNKIKGDFQMFVQDVSTGAQYLINSNGINYIETTEQSKVLATAYGAAKKLNKREIDLIAEANRGAK